MAIEIVRELADHHNRHPAPLSKNCFRMNIPRWEIRCTASDHPIVRHVSAFSSASAWRKFCEMYFGALKPAKDDYVITLESEVA